MGSLRFPAAALNLCQSDVRLRRVRIPQKVGEKRDMKCKMQNAKWKFRLFFGSLHGSEFRILHSALRAVGSFHQPGRVLRLGLEALAVLVFVTCQSAEREAVRGRDVDAAPYQADVEEGLGAA